MKIFNTAIALSAILLSFSFAPRTFQTGYCASYGIFTKGTDITVVVTGGPNAGSYHATKAESTCSMGMTGDSSFGNQYSEDGKKDNELSSVQLIIDNYESAKRGEETNFSLTAGFGNLAFGKSYTIKSETGKLSVAESSSGKVITVDGTTTAGVHVHAVIACMSVQKLVNGFLKEE